MCKLSYKVCLCGCEDPNCTQKTGPYNEAIEENGHIIRITEYHRVSGMCLDWFENDTPHRTVLEYGFPEHSSNSKQDCKGLKEWRIHEDVTRDLQICKECERNCTQPDISPKLADLIGTFLIAQKQAAEKAYFKKKELAAILEGKEHAESPKQKSTRIQRRNLCKVLSRSQIMRYFGELKRFDIQQLLTEEEKEIVEKNARTMTKQLPGEREAERYRERIRGLHFTDQDFVDQGEIPYRRRQGRGSYRLPM